MVKLRVFEAFSGVGSQKMALRNKNINHEVVAISEIDKYAIKSYGNIHKDILAKVPEVTKGLSDENMYSYLEGRNVPLNYKTFECTARKLKGDELKQVYTSCKLTNNLGDISKIKTEDIPDHDLFTYSFPCQDISVAGKQLGLDINSGSRSGLLWECQKVISVKRPKYLVLENVKNLVGKSHRQQFEVWLQWLESQGYTNYWKVINALETNTPQSRERIFVVSVLNDSKEFVFPAPKELTSSIADILESNPDEKFFLDDSRKSDLVFREIKKPTPIIQLGNIYSNSKFANPQRGRVYSIEGVAPTLTTCGGGGLEPKVLLPNGRIRKLTPKEFWRLMGFTDSDYTKAAELCSNTQLYKQAGNSIVVPVLESIFEVLLSDYVG